jgi:CheY-like chemotaxis protein
MSKILVIEDVSAVLLSLRIILTGLGHDVTCANKGINGLQALRESAFDLVISDIWMPGMNGAEVIAEGRARAPATRFLAITGGDPNSGALPQERARSEFGADKILYKPFEKEALVAAVTELLAGTPAHG